MLLLDEPSSEFDLNGLRLLERLAARGVNTLILDAPTNHLGIEGFLAESGGSGDGGASAGVAGDGLGGGGRAALGATPRARSARSRAPPELERIAQPAVVDKLPAPAPVCRPQAGIRAVFGKHRAPAASLSGWTGCQDRPRRPRRPHPGREAQGSRLPLQPRLPSRWSTHRRQTETPARRSQDPHQTARSPLSREEAAALGFPALVGKCFGPTDTGSGVRITSLSPDRPDLVREALFGLEPSGS